MLLQVIRWLDVRPARLPAWANDFAERHGGVAVADGTPDVLVIRACDGVTAECHIPFAPLPGGFAAVDDEERVAARAAEIAAHAVVRRRVGVLLVRLGGHAAGVFEGDRLVASKVGSRLVHGRSAAGGQSQQRFARRREKQVHEALGEAAEVARRVLTPLGPDRAPDLDALICGGDRRAVAALRADPRLRALFALETEPFLTVPDPKLVVLREAPRRFQAVRVRLTEPG